MFMPNTAPKAVPEVAVIVPPLPSSTGMNTPVGTPPRREDPFHDLASPIQAIQVGLAGATDSPIRYERISHLIPSCMQLSRSTPERRTLHASFHCYF